MRVIIENIYNKSHEEGYRLYCGRGGHGHSGVFGNQFEIGKDGSREEVIAKFEEYADKHPELMELMRKELREVGNPEVVILQCFCWPQACHTRWYKKELEK